MALGLSLPSEDAGRVILLLWREMGVVVVVVVEAEEVGGGGKAGGDQKLRQRVGELVNSVGEQSTTQPNHIPRVRPRSKYHKITI
jgi:hypothetical protein